MSATRQDRAIPTEELARRDARAIDATASVPFLRWPTRPSAARPGDGSLAEQATWLAGERLHPGQRRAYAQHLGRTLGNGQVQRIMGAAQMGSCAVQRDRAGDVPADPEQLMNQLGMMAQDGSFAQWFAGHWRAALGYNPQRYYVGGGGAWTWGGGTTEYTFRPNARQRSLPNDWHQEMQELYRRGEPFGTDAAAVFAWNRNSLQQTIDYWAAGFDERVRSAAGEHAYNFVRNPEYRRFLSVMGLRPPEVSVPSAMAGSPYYRPSATHGAFGSGGGAGG